MKGETIVLTRDENDEVAALTDLPDPRELRIDQILTSEFFGLRSTYDANTEKLFDEYYKLLSKDHQDRSEVENIRIHELNELIPKIKHLGNDLREELVYYVIDELLAKEARSNDYQLKEKLKETALERVRNLWKSINPEI